MIKILVPTDGSERSLRAVRFVVDLHGRLGPLEACLLYVQAPHVRDGRVAHEPPLDEGRDVLQSAETMLATAGLRFRSEWRSGYIPQAIARVAAEMQCDAIVMGTKGMGTTDEVLGSIARQVINLADVPVVLVK